MPAGFSKGFEEYLPPDDRMIERVITQGLVVLDTNVLLDAYRYARKAREELLEILRRIGDRLWIPHQVALEFHRNRASVIASHSDSYREMQKATQEFRQAFEGEFSRRIREFANRVSMSDAERDALGGGIAREIEVLASNLNQLQRAHGVSDRFISTDPVLDAIRSVLDGKVGEPFSEADEGVAREEALRRIDAGVPPGYKDSGKEDPSGDYLVWAQTLKEAADRKLPLVFVTRDTKEDWFLRVHGKTVSALPELVREARTIANIEFVVMTTRTLLVHAQRFLNGSVSESTLKQVEAAQRVPRPRTTVAHMTIGGDLLMELLRYLDRRLSALEAADVSAEELIASVATQSVAEAGEAYRKAKSALTMNRLTQSRLSKIRNQVSGMAPSPTEVYEVTDELVIQEIDRFVTRVGTAKGADAATR